MVQQQKNKQSEKPRCDSHYTVNERGEFTDGKMDLARSRDCSCQASKTQD